MSVTAFAVFAAVHPTISEFEYSAQPVGQLKPLCCQVLSITDPVHAPMTSFMAPSRVIRIAGQAPRGDST